MSDTDDIVEHYASGYEADRLANTSGRLEFVRTLDILKAHLPGPPAVVLDVGGGTGPYARWLTTRGYEVHLVDLSPVHVERARTETPALASAEVGDARALSWADASVDAVLLMGPLYHLIVDGDRIAALREAHRVLRSGGVLIASAVSRYASLLDGLRKRYFDDPAFASIVEEDLRSGQHRNPTNHPEYFMSTYFHRREDLEAEIGEGKLRLRTIVGVEGPGWMLHDFNERWADPKRRAQLVDAARRMESEPAISAHLLAVATAR